MLAHPVMRYLGYILVFAATIGFLCYLGFWQWQRAAEKQVVLDNMQVSRDFRNDSLLTNKDLLRHDFAHVQISGRWLAKPALLLENRWHASKPGFHVLNAFQLLSGQVVVVNRGWHGLDNIGVIAREILPSGQLDIRGRLYKPQKGFTLGPAFVNEFDGVQVDGKTIWQMQYYDFMAISDKLQLPVLPKVMVLDSDAPNALVSNWQPLSVPPSRHIGYAVQWWGLSLVALIYAIIFFRRRRRNL